MTVRHNYYSQLLHCLPPLLFRLLTRHWSVNVVPWS